MSNDLNLNNIFLCKNKEIYIQELINWLEERKKNGNKILVTSDENIVELIII